MSAGEVFRGALRARQLEMTMARRTARTTQLAAAAALTRNEWKKPCWLEVVSTYTKVEHCESTTYLRRPGYQCPYRVYETGNGHGKLKVRNPECKKSRTLILDAAAHCG